MDITIALLLDNIRVDRWKYEAVKQLLNSEDVSTSLKLILINGKNDQKLIYERAFNLVKNFSAWRCFAATRKAWWKVVGPPWFREPVSLRDVLDLSGVTIATDPTKSTDGFGTALTQKGVDDLSGVDVAIRFGFGVIKGAALHAPKYGIISYHHGDFSKYRGRPAGFYEFLHGEENAGVTLQKLEEKLDGGTVISYRKCNINNVTSLTKVRDLQFRCSTTMLSEGVANLAYGDIPDQPNKLGDVYSTPSLIDMIKYTGLKIKRTLT